MEECLTHKHAKIDVEIERRYLEHDIFCFDHREEEFKERGGRYYKMSIEAEKRKTNIDRMTN